MNDSNLFFLPSITTAAKKASGDKRTLSAIYKEKKKYSLQHIIILIYTSKYNILSITFKVIS